MLTQEQLEEKMKAAIVKTFFAPKLDDWDGEYRLAIELRYPEDKQRRGWNHYFYEHEENFTQWPPQEEDHPALIDRAISESAEKQFQMYEHLKWLLEVDS